MKKKKKKEKEEKREGGEEEGRRRRKEGKKKKKKRGKEREGKGKVLRTLPYHASGYGKPQSGRIAGARTRTPGLARAQPIEHSHWQDGARGARSARGTSIRSTPRVYNI
jgi:hypothetical protein